MPDPVTPREVGDTPRARIMARSLEENRRCADCGWMTRMDREYHPFVACIIVKATHRDPLPYLRDVAADMATVNDQGQFPIPVEESAVSR